MNETNAFFFVQSKIRWLDGVDFAQLNNKANNIYISTNKMARNRRMLVHKRTPNNQNRNIEEPHTLQPYLACS